MATNKRITDLAAASTLIGDELLEVSQVSTTVTITAATISALASDNSYNDSGAGFVTAGFVLGDRVRVTGFTGNVANNIIFGIITALTTGKMTIGGTEGDVIADDAAGESVTIAKWGSRRALLSDIGIGGGGGSSWYDLSSGFNATPGSSEVLDTFPVVRDVTFAEDFANSVGIIGVNPTSTMAILVKDDGTTIGAISISTSGVFTFTTVASGDTVVLAGSFLTFVGPATADATAANASYTLAGAA